MKKKFKIPLYFGYLAIYQVSEKKMKAIINKNDLKKFGLSPKLHDAFFFKGKNSYNLVCKKGYCNARVVAHEALHVANAIFLDRGVESDQENDEHLAYLLGWIVGKCHNHLKLNKIKDV